jgi:branched-chain amino acid transport system permease protein
VASLTAVLLDGLLYSSWLFVVAVGLTMIYGVMKILNIAHGSLYALGAYAAASLVGWYFAGGYPPAGAYFLLFGAALAVGVVFGVVIERSVLRRMYGGDEVLTVLATYALFLILDDAVKLIWGVDPYFAYQPYTLPGFVDIFGLPYQVYDLCFILIAVALGAGLWWWLNRTIAGKLLAAVIHDREMSAAFGINVRKIYVLTFVAGSVLGALGGALTAPKISVAPGLGVDVIVLAFAVVVIGGLGSVGGAIVGALIVGFARAMAVHWLPQAELFAIYMVMALVLAARPKGLFALAEARKI